MCPNKRALLSLAQLTIIRAISAAVAVLAIVKFTVAQKRTLPRQRIMFKLVAFKLIVFFNFLQTVRHFETTCDSS